MPLVVDERLAAGRGHAFSAAAARERQEEAIQLAHLDDEDFRCGLGGGQGAAGGLCCPPKSAKEQGRSAQRNLL